MTWWPYVSSNGVNPVAVCGIVSEHGIREPLIPVGSIVIYVMSETLRQCSMWAFQCSMFSRWYADIWIFSIFNNLQVFLNISLVKFVLWSVRIFSGIPCSNKIFVTNSFAIVAASWFARGIALLNFVKLSWNVNIYLFPFVVTVNGPTMSKAHFSNGLVGVSVIVNGIFVFRLSLFFWQYSHLLMYSFTSLVIPRQLCSSLILLRVRAIP